MLSHTHHNTSCLLQQTLHLWNPLLDIINTMEYNHTGASATPLVQTEYTIYLSHPYCRGPSKHKLQEQEWYRVHCG